VHPQFLGERHNVVATLQTLDSHLPKRLGISTYYSFLCHSQFPFFCKVCLLPVSHLKGSVHECRKSQQNRTFRLIGSQSPHGRGNYGIEQSHKRCAHSLHTGCISKRVGG
jgi:hypothetical protein